MIDLAESRTIYRELRGSIDSVSHGVGPYLFLRDGRRLFDFSGGPCVTSLGHSCSAVIERIHEQLQRVPYAYSGFWGTDVSEQLGERVAAEFESTWPGWVGKTAFASAGNEAVDFACRIAAQYWIERGEPRHRFAVREFSFHGVGLLTSALTDDYGRYMLMTPYYEDTRRDYLLRIPGYVDQYEDVDQYEEKVLRETERLIVEARTPVAAILLETVGGPPVGAFRPSTKYLRGLREICDRQDVLLIFDEVLCGCGRVGAFTAAQAYDVRPDLIVLGKGITSGYVPLSAVVVSSKVLSVLEAGSGVAMVGTTYFDHSTACAAGLATLEHLDDYRLIERSASVGAELIDYMRKQLENVPIVRRVHGTGMLFGIELVASNGLPFSPALQVHKQVRQELYKAGIVTYSKGQTVHGARDYVILAPAFNTQRDILFDHFDTVVDVLTKFPVGKDW